MTLRQAEEYLRRDDKALRLRRSMEGPNVLVERKTFRGVYGAHGPDGLVWTPDAGRRREEGHLLVCTLPGFTVDARSLRESLQRADTWRQRDRIDRVERRDRLAHEARKRARTENIRYKSHEIFDRYVWQSKSRVSTYLGSR